MGGSKPNKLSRFTPDYLSSQGASSGLAIYSINALSAKLLSPVSTRGLLLLWHPDDVQGGGGCDQDVLEADPVF